MRIGLGLWTTSAIVPAAAPPAAGAVWNDSAGTPASNAAYAISGGGTVATRASGATDALVFGSSGHTTGTQSFIVTPNRSTGIFLIGLSNASETNTNFCGGTANSIGIFNSDGDIYRSGGIIQSPAATIGNTTPITVILKNQKVYFQVSGADVSGMNSTAETGGVDVSGMGTLYPAASCNGVNDFTADFTLWS